MEYIQDQKEIFCFYFCIQFNMSQSTQQQMHFFDDSICQVNVIPSQLYQGEQSNSLPQQQSDRQAQTISTRQQTNKREHTAPKLLLSVMNKILYWSPDTTNQFKKLLKEANQKHNNSTSIKFMLLAMKSNLIGDLKRQFSIKSQQKLNHLRYKKNWNQTRYVTAWRWKIIIQQSLKFRDYKQAFERIWRGHNHQGRYKSSLDQVKSYKKKISKYRKSELIK